MVAASDDLALLLVQHRPGGLRTALLHAWRDERLFRPLAVISGGVIDPVLRSGWLVVAAQGATLGIGVFGVLRVCKRLTSTVSCSLVCALWLLHPSTSVSVWQMDTLSQTASAAAGLWLLALACGGWVPKYATLAWLGVTLLGLLTKETFLGWLPVALLVHLRGQWPVKKTPALPVTLAMLLGAVFVLARLIHLGRGVVADGGETYALHFGPTILKNLAVLIAGGVAFGPVHALRVLGVSDASWWFALVGILSHVGLLMLAAVRAPSTRRDVALLWMLGLAALGPVLLLGHVSELYLMGPNALLCLTLAHASSRVALVSPRFAGAIRVALAAVLVCGWVGLASRAYHFSLTWQYSRALSLQARGLKLHPVAPRVDSMCNAQPLSHSVYFVSPLAAVGPTATFALAAAEGHPLPAQWTSELDCRALAPRGRW